MDRKNINRGFKKLRVWQDAVSLYTIAYRTLSHSNHNSRPEPVNAHNIFS
jgi:hypothetical protein